MFLGKGILKICSKFTGEHQCQSVIAIKLQSNVIEIALRHGRFSANFQHIFKTPFSRNISGFLLPLRTSKQTNTYHKSNVLNVAYQQRIQIVLLFNSKLNDCAECSKCSGRFNK